MPDTHGPPPESQASPAAAVAPSATGMAPSPAAVAEPSAARPTAGAGDGPAVEPDTPSPPPGARLTLRELLTTYRPVLVLSVIAASAEAAYAAINMLALQVFVDEVLNLTSYLGFILGAFLG